MSVSTVGTDDAAEVGTQIDESATQIGASPYGESQSSATKSPAEDRLLELGAKVADLAKTIDGNTTNNSPSVGLVVTSSTYLGGASGPEDRSVSPDNASPFHPTNGIAPPSTVGSTTALASGPRGSDNTDNADTQPTLITDDKDSKSEGSATDEARRGTDSDPSDHSQISDRSSGGSPDPTSRAFDAIGTWVPDTALQQPGYPTAIETQGTTTPPQSSIRETTDHICETQNDSSQISGQQSSRARSSHDPHHRNRGLVNYNQPPRLSPADVHLEVSPQNQSPPVSSPVMHVDAEGKGHITKLLKRTVTVVGLVAALVFGIVAYVYKQDVLLACTVVIMIAGVDSMIQAF